MKPYLCISLALMIAGCATTASDVVGSLDPNASMPSREQINQELRGCTFSLEKVGTKLQREHPDKFHPWPNKVYERLLAVRLAEAFHKSGIGQPTGKSCAVIVMITETKFGHEGLISSPSKLSTAVTIAKISGDPILTFPMATGWSSIAPIILPGIVSAVVIPRSGPGEHAYEIPAIAILITKTLVGFRNGKTFDEIELETEAGGGLPRSDTVVKRPENNPWGLTPVSLRETQVMH